jgi:ketosteroid isomerase-like protein
VRINMWCSVLMATAMTSQMIVPLHAATAEESRVMAITQLACDAFRTQDISAIKKLLAPEFTLVSSTSQVQTRDEVIAEVKSGDPKYEVFRNHSMSAKVYGNAAIVQGITSVKGASGGTPFAVDVRFTDTLIRHKGKWRLIVSHVTRIPKEKM